ncbi:MAG: PAS domain-containing protein, partial [Candidatus Dadabacteria bacterium]
MVVLLSCLGLPGVGEGAGEIRVGVYENPPLLVWTGEGGYGGVGVDLVAEVARREGWELTFVPCGLAECLSALEEGRIDLIPALAFSPQRAERFGFSGETVVVAWGQVFARPEAEVRSILDLEGRRVALTRGSIFAEPFLRLVESFQVKAEPVWGPSHEEALQLVAAGQADAAVVNVLLARRAAQRYGVEETPVLFSPVDVRMAAHRGVASEILPVLDRYLAAWKREPGSPYHRALDRWIGLRGEPAGIPRWVKLGAAGAGATLVLLAAGVLVLRREVARRTAALAGRNAELAAEVARREQAETSLTEALERLRVILDASPAAIVAVDREGRVTGWSRGAERLFGWDEA